MAGCYMRNSSWQGDTNLKEHMANYVRQRIQRKEMVDFLKRDFPHYAWSIPTLDRRLRFFQISYIDKDVSLDVVKEAVAKELEGPGQLLGYRAMQHKVRQEHGLNVPRELVYAVLTDLDPDGLASRAVGGKKKKKKGCFTSKGPNWVFSMDGHDKLMGYQNNTYPLAVYGCIDTASRKLLWLRVWTTNSEPKLVCRWYLDYLYESRCIPAKLRMDHGTETVVLSTMHSFIRRHHGDMDPADTVLYGKSTSNQIERWWKELHERLEKYHKRQLNWLKDQGHYDPHNLIDRMLLAFVMIPLLQMELDTFKDVVWNTHRIRPQKDTELPNGIPNHIFSFPEKYGLENCGWPITEQQLEEAAHHSGVLEIEDDFLDPNFRRECERLIPSTEKIEADACVDAYIYLKKNFTPPQ